METQNLREQRGLEIAQKNNSQITRIDCAIYKVLSQSGNSEYVVCLSEDEWHCECPDCNQCKSKEADRTCKT